MTVDLALVMIRWVESDMCDWNVTCQAAFVSIFAALLTGGHRLSEVLPGGVVKRGFRLGDLEAIDECTGVRSPLSTAMADGHQGPFVVTVQKSKADQQGEGMCKVFALVEDHPLCPSTTLRSFWGQRALTLSAAWGTQDFLYCDESGSPITTGRFRAMFAEAATAAGIEDADIFLPHSTKVGCNTLFLAAGVSAEERDMLIGWKRKKGPMNALYSRAVLSVALKAQRAMLLSGPVVELKPKRRRQAYDAPRRKDKGHVRRQRQIMSPHRSSGRSIRSTKRSGASLQREQGHGEDGSTETQIPTMSATGVSGLIMMSKVVAPKDSLIQSLAAARLLLTQQ